VLINRKCDCKLAIIRKEKAFNGGDNSVNYYIQSFLKFVGMSVKYSLGFSTIQSPYTINSYKMIEVFHLSSNHITNKVLLESNDSPRNRGKPGLPETSVESSTCFDFFLSFSFNFTLTSLSFFFSFSTSFSFSLASFSIDFSLFSFLLGNLNDLDFLTLKGS